jgi:cytochrome c oxidase subunit I+III
MTLFLWARASRGHTSARRRSEYPIVILWADYLVVITLLALPAAQLPGLLP